MEEEFIGRLFPFYCRGINFLISTGSYCQYIDHHFIFHDLIYHTKIFDPQFSKTRQVS